MPAKDELEERILESLPEERVQQVLEFAQFLEYQDERSAWQRFGETQLARAYGANEPEYTVADRKIPRT